MVQLRSFENGTVAVADLGLLSAGAPGRLYRICWRAYKRRGDLAGFRATLGVLSIAGPLQESWRCKLGAHCSVTLIGVELRPENRLAIALDGCATPFPTWRNVTESAASAYSYYSS